MNFLKYSVPFGAALALFFLVAFQVSPTQASSGEVKLTADEVRATFIGNPWRGSGGGRFHFETDGNYSYTNYNSSASGTYEIRDDGTICTTGSPESKSAGRVTCYTFYRHDTDYRYFHDRSGKYWPAYVD